MRNRSNWLTALCGALLVVLVLGLSHQAYSDTPKDNPAKPVPGNLDTMSGYTFKQFGDFQKDWHMVTARYRKDTTEMRITYANDIAWKTLVEGKTDYPDGAMFAKVGLMTEEDPAFPSSAVPSGGVRYQFMVRDKKKHASTNGWGYAIFGLDGKTFGHDPISGSEVTTLACNACHEIVPERGYVFSKPLKTQITEATKLTPEAAARLTYWTEKVAPLPEKIKQRIPKQYTEIRLLRSPMQVHMFDGTLNEIIPMLTKEALASNLPAALMSNDGRRFSLVLVDPDNPRCKLPTGKGGIGMKNIFTGSIPTAIKAIEAEGDPHPVSARRFCEAKP